MSHFQGNAASLHLYYIETVLVAVVFLFITDESIPAWVLVYKEGSNLWLNFNLGGNYSNNKPKQVYGQNQKCN